jgi:ankyrin repeat protein
MDDNRKLNNDLNSFYQKLSNSLSYEEIKTNFNALENFMELRDEEQFTILHKACYLNNNMLVKIILDNKGITSDWINSRSKVGFTALHFASYKGNLEIVDLLIKKGAKFDSENEKGLNVLHLSAQNNQIEPIIYFTQKYGMDINVKDREGSTALHWACYTGSETVVTFLLNLNIEINAKDIQGLTPLHLAVISGM